VIACGAIAQAVAEASTRHTVSIDVHPLPPGLHNRPDRIPAAVEEMVGELRGRYDDVAVGYADCGTYGALDQVCARLSVVRLPGSTCFDIYAGESHYDALMSEQPGTFIVTDYLVKSLSHTVIHGLGLDRFPELRDDYFQHYTRMVWLVQTTDAQEEAELWPLARAAAERISLPLEVLHTGVLGLRDALSVLVGQVRPARR